MSDQPHTTHPWTPQGENPYLSKEVDGWEDLPRREAPPSHPQENADTTQMMSEQPTVLADADATQLVRAPETLDATSMINAGSPPAPTDATVVDTSLMGYGASSHGRPHVDPSTPVSHQASPAVDVARAEVARNALDNRDAFGQHASQTSAHGPFGRPPKSASAYEGYGIAKGSVSRQREPLAAKRLRFWRWFRTLPILCLVVMAVASVALSHLSGATLRHWLYPVHYAQQITAQAERYGIDPTLVASVIKAESNWVPNAESSVGAQGLMQVMPETARDLARRGYVGSSRYDPTDLMDPETNIAYGTAYLASLMKATGSEERAIASYNAGPNAVSGWEGEGDSFSDAIQYPETRIYLEKVQSALDHYRELYPQGLQDDGSQP